MSAEPSPAQEQKQPDRESFERWTHTIALIRLAFTIAGFLVVIFTVLRIDAPTKRSVFASMSQWTMDIDKTFIEYPEFRPYFYAGKQIKPDDPQYNRAVSIAEMMIDSMDSVLQHSKAVRGGVVYEGWDNWIDDSFETSPLLREQMERYERWLKGGELESRWEKWKAGHPNVPVKKGLGAA